MRTLALLLLVGTLVAGCRTARSSAPIQPTPLEVPPAPPRIVVAAPAPVPSLPERVPELPAPPATAPPRPRQPAAAAKEIQKPEGKPDDGASAAAPTAPPQGNPAPVLRTPATADTAAAERVIRETMTRAQGGLRTVEPNYSRLSPERQKAYDQAQDFLASAEAQLKSQNFEMAKELAEKADKLARELQAR